MDAVHDATTGARRIEIDGQAYYEDVRGRFVPADMFRAEPRVPAGVLEFGDKRVMVDGQGRFVPVETVRAQDKLCDEMVRGIIAFALDLSEQVRRFYAHTMRDLDAFDALLEQQYGLVKRGRAGKGNRSYLSHDQLWRVRISVSDRIDFGPELQVAKALFDECVTDWSDSSGPELRSLIGDAFDVDKEGRINRANILKLLRRDIEDPRWRKAMEAISAAVTVVASKEYIQFHHRADTREDWTAITINLAKA